MNIKYMQYFISLAEEENFSVAAQKLGVTQPTLTQAIKKIESSLGVNLFDRSGRDVTINAYGRIYLETCKKVIRTYNDGLKKIEDAELGANGLIKVALTSSKTPGIMPAVIRVFHEQFPETRIELEECPTSEIEKKVERGETDIGIRVGESEDNPLLSYVPLFFERILIAVSDGVIAGNESLSALLSGSGTGQARLADFADVPFILLGEDQPIVKLFRKSCEEKLIDVDCIARCRNYSTALSLANDGLGATLFADGGPDYFGSLFPKLRYFALSDTDMIRGLYLIYRKNMYMGEPLRRFTEILKDNFRTK